MELVDAVLSGGLLLIALGLLFTAARGIVNLLNTHTVCQS